MNNKINRNETEQEKFWKGEFGNEYIERNKSQLILANKTALYSKIISRMDEKVSSCIEFGSNVGLNLLAINRLLPECELSAIEINKNATEELKKNEGLKVYHQSILDFETDYQRDLAFIHGVLIHINPECKNEVYRRLYETSKKYILMIEYYNPTPVEVTYRGIEGNLFKSDFAGEMMDLYPELKLVDYGFVYYRDNQFPLGDCTWFLLKKEMVINNVE